jgi:hypothetical protein
VVTQRKLGAFVIRWRERVAATSATASAASFQLWPACWPSRDKTTGSRNRRGGFTLPPTARRLAKACRLHVPFPFVPVLPFFAFRLYFPRERERHAQKLQFYLVSLFVFSHITYINIHQHTSTYIISWLMYVAVRRSPFAVCRFDFER